VNDGLEHLATRVVKVDLNVLGFINDTDTSAKTKNKPNK
jgi:hypothetical protein